MYRDCRGRLPAENSFQTTFPSFEGSQATKIGKFPLKSGLKTSDS
jgi:hypothetical protein